MFAQNASSHAAPASPAPAAAATFTLDPSAAAKQMAALNAISQARIASRTSAAAAAAGGTSSGPFLGGTPAAGQNATSHDSPVHPVGLFSDPAMSRPLPAAPAAAAQNHNQPIKSRQRNFLAALANFMASRGTPLPPGLSGVPYPPHYDPAKSPWKSIEVSPTEIGCFRLAGKDIDLFRLWGLAFQAGGANKISSGNNWGMLLTHFELPEQMPNKNGGTSQTAVVLAQYYMAILFPFEELYKRNVSEQQRKLAARQQQQQQQQQQQGNLGPHSHPPSTSAVGTSGMQPSAVPSNPVINGASQLVTPSTTLLQQPSNPMPQPDHSDPIDPSNAPGPSSSSSHSAPDTDTGDSVGSKRKLDSDGNSSKRSKQKTEPDTQPNEKSSALEQPSGSSSSQPVPGARSQLPPRRKIEYVPYAREVDTYGGRDLRGALDMGTNSLIHRRPWRDHNDWGCVDIEVLTMFVRSRISKEVSYALTTFTLLSMMRGSQGNTGFPVSQCGDLLNDVLDLLEDDAFDGVDDTDSPDDDGPITTHCELINIIQAVEGQPFASLENGQGSKDPSLGPKQRPGNIILIITNIIRNLVMTQDNADFLARHDRMLHILLRVCSLTRSPTLHASSPALSLSDVAMVRKDTLQILCCISNNVLLSSNPSPSSETLRAVRRAFRLVASYLVHKSEAMTPTACFQAQGMPTHTTPKPPTLPDMALEVFTRLSLLDLNRQIFAKAVPVDSMWCLFEALVHRLPVSDSDFQLITNEFWLSYTEKIVLALYSLAFLSPPHLKIRIKSDRTLGFSKVMFRMINKFLLNQAAEVRAWFHSCARRTIETMTLVDNAEDSFDTPKSTMPPMSFGMGYGEIGDNAMDQGAGLLSAHRDIAWEMMMMREVDDLMFNELDSLARLECS